ncbi:hypothetical protein AM493_11290 [Flavobacterium akiainvivens]|uniref:DUF4369 domain-containing protein n=1 Tax=Flavobacterium akiainvivens TaxID=1202724 RepID=A0A0M8MDH6_9FLAO|nr:hypothetical protein [Flavobacterium akiainvivens]KOS06554.1 hypothetical protein AM493_11290 [Flavobacterium akiainvivens]SFQ10672.1 hypothetical protein SAMN05444144_101100 [Flavobacterium akiainvivens]
MKPALMWLLLLIFGVASAQQELRGRVMVDTVGVGGAFVINQKTGQEVKTGHDGSFTIAVKPGQKLAVSSASIDVREFYISAESFKQQPYILGVDYKSYELDEVVVESTVTAESLGIVPKGQKRYTAAEKKVLHYRGQQKGLTGVLNWMRGKKFLMEIDEKYANKRVAIEALQRMYTESQLVNDLHIPKQFTEAFLYFAVDDEKLAGLLRAYQYGAARLIMSEVALRYIETISTHEEAVPDTDNNDVPAANGTAAPEPARKSGGQ